MSLSSHISWKSADPDQSLKDAVVSLDCSLHELKSQAWNASKGTIGPHRETDLSGFVPSKGEWSFLQLRLNTELGDRLAKQLSVTSEGPVILFKEYDQDAWGFVVFKAGILRAQFWNKPEVVELEPSECSVDPALIASLFGVEVNSIAPYLKHLSVDRTHPARALPDDEFELEDHWVRCDFMRRLGIRYPEPREPGWRYVLIEELSDPFTIGTPVQKKSWWNIFKKG